MVNAILGCIPQRDKKLDNEEPQDISGVIDGVKKPVLTLEIEKTPSSSIYREVDLIEEVKTLKKREKELEVPIGRKMSNEQGSLGTKSTVFGIMHAASETFCL